MEDTEGEQVLTEAVSAAVDVFGDELEAAFALGSLAHCGFAPLVSDVDLVLVLRRIVEHTPGRIEQVAGRLRGGPGLSDRLSIFWSDWPGVRGESATPGRLPQVDRLDLLDSGRLLYGVDRRAPATRPDTATLVRGAAEFAASRFDAGYRRNLWEPERLVALGVRPLTKAVLFPVRFGYTLHTGRVGHNDAAVDWHRGRRRAGHPLAAEAFDWRRRGIGDTGHARELLARHLVDIYLQFYAEHIDRLGSDPLVERLAVQREDLVTGSAKGPAAE